MTSKQKLQWIISKHDELPGVHCAELWDSPFVGPRLAMTRWVRSKGQARKDGRKVFASFEELED